MVKAGVRIVPEGSNMGCTAEAINVFEASRKSGPGGVWYAPGSTLQSLLSYFDGVKFDTKFLFSCG